MNQQPQQLSNNLEDFVAGGIYQGGAGIVQDIRYTLWDYEGKVPPNSVVAVHMVFQPTDGSNDNKPVDVFWSAGNADDFQPDHTGGFLYSSTKQGQSSSTNWADVEESLKMTCGFDLKQLNGPTGILVLIGGEMTLVRRPQKQRDNLAGQEPNKKRDILVPTFFRFKGQGGVALGARPVAVPAAAVGAAPATAPAPAAVPVGAVDIGATLRAIITEAGGVVSAADLPKLLLNKLVAVGPMERVNIIKSCAGPALVATAAQYGLTFSGDMLMG